MSDDLITFLENSSEISRGLHNHMKTDVTAALRPGESRQDNAPYGDTGTPTAWRLLGPHPPPQAQRKRRGVGTGGGAGPTAPVTQDGDTRNRRPAEWLRGQHADAGPVRRGPFT